MRRLSFVVQGLVEVQEEVVVLVVEAVVEEG
jgi:hypothetical protein